MRKDTHMASINHQFVQFSEQVYARYVKTVPYIVSGMRSNPFEPGKLVSWVLQTPEHNYDFETKRVTHVSYSDEVLEVYSAAEDAILKRSNRGLFEQGLLKEYTEAAPVMDTANVLTDEDVAEIARLTTLAAMKSKLATITSPVTLQRVRDKARELDRSVRIIELIDARIAELA